MHNMDPTLSCCLPPQPIELVTHLRKAAPETVSSGCLPKERGAGHLWSQMYHPDLVIDRDVNRHVHLAKPPQKSRPPYTTKIITLAWVIPAKLARRRTENDQQQTPLQGMGSEPPLVADASPGSGDRPRCQTTCTPCKDAAEISARQLAATVPGESTC
jgi:hypothetical protein